MKRSSDEIISPQAKKMRLVLENMPITGNVNYRIKEVDAIVNLNEAGAFVNILNDDFVVQSQNKDTVTIDIKIRERKYALRSRKGKPALQAASASAPTTSTTTTTATATATTTKIKTEAKTDILKVVKEINIDGEKFRVGEVVFAKTKGYCHWPAFITDISGIIILSVTVLYFGTHETAKINYRNKTEKMLIKFENGKEIIKANKKKYCGKFAGALEEAKIALKKSIKTKK